MKASDSCKIQVLKSPVRHRSPISFVFFNQRQMDIALKYQLSSTQGISCIALQHDDAITTKLTTSFHKFEINKFDRILLILLNLYRLFSSQPVGTCLALIGGHCPIEPYFPLFHTAYIGQMAKYCALVGSVDEFAIWAADQLIELLGMDEKL